MPYLRANDYSLNVEGGYTLLQALFIMNVVLPKFCFHEQLSIAGNCRMCLIEDVKSVKPIIACAINVSDGLEVFTETVKVKRAREAVLEFLLINHPLDCPICDQGGECDLQDLTLVYGGDKGRFYELKRVVINKFFGFSVKTFMNRCIHCTRCIRFASEVLGIGSLGVLGRGFLMEIGFYVEDYLDVGMAGNVVDLCPVGALTAKPYSFISRPWELRSVNYVDIFDVFLWPVVINMRGNSILRVMPVFSSRNEFEFISDKGRYVFDSIYRLRLQQVTFKLGFQKIYMSLSKSLVLLTYLFTASLRLLCLNKKKYYSSIFCLGGYLDVSELVSIVDSSFK